MNITLKNIKPHSPKWTPARKVRLNKLGSHRAFKQALIWVGSNYFPNQDLGTALNLVDRFQTWVSSRSGLWTIKRIKTIRLILIRYLSGKPLEKIKYLKYRGDLPAWLPGIPDIRKGNPDAIRFALTVLEYSKCINCWGKPDYSSITDSPKWNWEQTKDVLEDMEVICKELGLCLDSKWSGFHSTSKAGPNGPALGSAPSEINLLDDDLRSDLKLLANSEEFDTEFDKATELFGSLSYSNTIGKIAKRKDPCLRRISMVRDPEGKNRPIAILDYWSQTVLKPLHDNLFGLLRKFKPDATFNQDSAKQGKHNFCYDLSSATDRFPILIQKWVLGLLLEDDDRAHAWGRILVKRPYVTPEGDRLIYKTGQPMGAYSSWAMFSLCHHLVVQLSMKRAGLKPSLYTDCYTLLGDDIVIHDPAVALHYWNIIKSLGVKISEEKTTMSDDFMEFAKRFWHKGCNVTPFHIHGLLTTYRKFDTFMSFIANQEHGVYGLPAHPVSAIKGLLTSLGMSGRWSLRQASWLVGYVWLRRWLKYGERGYPLRILREICFMDFSCNQENIAESVLMELCAALKVQVIQESFIEGTRTINRSVKEYLQSLVECGAEIPHSDLDHVPMVYTCIAKQRELYAEVQTIEGTLSREDGMKTLLLMEYDFLPNPSLMISLKPRGSVSGVKPLIQKIFNFLIKERKDREDPR